MTLRVRYVINAVPYHALYNVAEGTVWIKSKR